MIKVILQKDVINLGDAGDICEVNDGYARNFLLPQKLAVRADKGSTKSVVHQKKLAGLKRDKRIKEMKVLAEKLNGKEIEIKVQTGENDRLFGSVTPIDIANELKKEGFVIDKRKIELADNIKSLGKYDSKIRLAEGVSVKVNVNVTAA